MGKTFPNQRLIHINRERITTDFLGIKNDNWQAASRTLGAHALRLYLYLASNANNYNLALSPAAISTAIGMPRSTYHDQFKKLVDFGYLVPRGNNHYDFFETPQPSGSSVGQSEDGYDFENATADGMCNPQAVLTNPQTVFTHPSDSTEINKNKIDTQNIIINNGECEKQVSHTPQAKCFTF